MLVGFQGNMGQGKTLGQSVFANVVSRQTGLPIFTNYGLKYSDGRPTQKITKMSDLWTLPPCILCIDEIWINMDARLWKDNVTLTRFINQTRKKGLIVFYTTQHIRQVELRVRNATDILILCERKNGGIWYSFVDWQYKFVGRQFFLADPKPFYSLYDTFELVTPIEMDSDAGKQKTSFSSYRSKYNKKTS